MKFINVIFFKLVTYSLILTTPSLSMQFNDEKENLSWNSYKLDSSTGMDNLSLMDMLSSLRGSPHGSPKKKSLADSPSKNSPTKQSFLGLRERNQNVRTNSNPGSPPNRSPSVSPVKAGEKACIRDDSISSPVFKKLFDDEDSATTIKRACDFAKQSEQLQQTHTSNYLCALPTPETANAIEIVFQRATANYLLSQPNENAQGLLDKRSEATVFNCSSREWPVEKHYHMSLDLKKQEVPLDKQKFKNILDKVEFPFQEVSTLGRFIVIRLNEPQVKHNCIASDEEMQFLKGYLEYGDQPLMHVSLVKVNDEKKQMVCIKEGRDEVTFPVASSIFESKIQRAKCKGNNVHMVGLMKVFSQIFYWSIHLASDSVRSYLTRTLAIEGNEDELYEHINNRSKLCLHNATKFPAIGQHLIFDEYGFNYDFNGKIGIELDKVPHFPISKSLIATLFANIFLNVKEDIEVVSKEFDQLRNFLKFSIDLTNARIVERQSAIKGGVVNTDTIDDTFESFFDAEQVSLSSDTKELYEYENERDRLILKSIEENLAYELIQSRFFGFDYNVHYFVAFINNNQTLIQQAKSLEESELSPSDDLLNTMLRVSAQVAKSNFLSNTFSYKKGFDFRTSVKSLPPFICMSDLWRDDLKKQISVAMKEVVNENQLKIQQGVSETIRFVHSKIPDAMFWNKYIGELHKHFSDLMPSMMLQFSDVAHQPVDEDLDS